VSDGASHESAAGGELRTELVARRLRAAILDGSLLPGQRIRQAEIANRYQTSRIPVREALQLLQAEGLVVLSPHAGARVAHLDPAEIGDIYEIREHLEPFALQTSVPELSVEQRRALAEYVEAIEKSAAAGDLGQWADLDREFHLTAMSGASARLYKIIESLWNGTEYFRRTFLRLPEQIELAQLEHRLLLAAIHDNRAADAGDILRVHIRRTRETFLDHLDLFGGKDGTSAPQVEPGPHTE
jgi:DNA-binding GntR family transcriptional regulator